MKIGKDIVGEKFGKLTVIKYLRTDEGTGRIFECKCDCENETIVERRYGDLNSRDNHSCGCELPTNGGKNLIDITGKKYGNWTVIKKVDKPIGSSIYRKAAYWECECICGTIKILYGSTIKDGRSTSCGCKKPEIIAEKGRKYDPNISSALRVFNGGYADGNLIIEDFIRIATQNCYYCGKSVEKTYNAFKNSNIEYSKNNGDFSYNGLDRIDNNKGHNLDNVVPCCFQCNRAKSTYNIEEFREWVINIYDNFIKRS
jgi:hypothetical protein